MEDATCDFCFAHCTPSLTYHDHAEADDDATLGTPGPVPTKMDEFSEKLPRWGE